MIEMMLEAERAMGIGLIDNAERLYRQVVAIDPKNSIAVTGLARVALERGDQRGAYTYARQALALDPDNPVAGHLAMRMAEQMRNRGEALPEVPAAPATPTPAQGRPEDPASARPGLVGRLFRRGR
jgi:Flp pilus assembly protein TadD